MGHKLTKMQRYHSVEDTDTLTTSATEPHTAMSETTSNIDVNELMLTEDNSTTPATATSEPTSNSDCNGLTLEKFPYVLGDVRNNPKFWIQVNFDNKYPYTYLNSSNFSMCFDAIEVNRNNPTTNTTALFILTDITPPIERPHKMIVTIQCVCSDKTWLTALRAGSPLLFLQQGSPGSIVFTLKENPQAAGQYRIKTRVNGDKFYLTTKRTRSRKKIVTMQMTRPSTYAFKISY